MANEKNLKPIRTKREARERGKNMKQKGSALAEDIIREYYTKLAFTNKTRKKDCDKHNFKVACKRK